jgi:MoxR-like ATPase
MITLDETFGRFGRLRERLDGVVLGQETVKEQALICLLGGGHALVEGVPGTAKTLLALSLARLLGCRFRRIQFTPDLMPADLLGTNVFSARTQEFEFRAGPVFTDVLLADEINRTPPRTQAALLECMQDGAATIDGVRHPISAVFTVLATQNPVEFEGTYPLPEAQRDRFLLKIEIGYPDHDAERLLVASYAAGRRLHDQEVDALEPVMSLEELLGARRVVEQSVRVEEAIQAYILAIVQATRQDELVQFGAGPRAALALLAAARARAALQQRDFVTPDDVKSLARAALVHRVVLSPEAEMEGTAIEDLLRRIFERVAVPR